MISSQNIPHLIKYMGAKREILEYVTGSIQNLNVDSEWLCDLFSGTSIISASLKDEYNIHANDIQQYSAIFSNTYLLNLNRLIPPLQIQEIEERVCFLVSEFKERYPQLEFDYTQITNYKELQQLEKAQQELISFDFGIGFNLFTKYYSGTYWSFEQCVWIDSIRAIAEDYIGTPSYYAILSALIFSIFSLLALIFTHGGVVKDFATKYSKDNMKGVFYIDSKDKQLTNIRSALVVAEATDPTNRRKNEVPYDFSVVYYNPKVGKLFKKVLLERISRFTNKELSNDEFYSICIENEFHKALSLTFDQFKTWLEGYSFNACYVKELHISNFLSIKEPVDIDFEKSKYIFLERMVMESHL